MYPFDLAESVHQPTDNLRADGIAPFLQNFGLNAELVDNDSVTGNSTHDLLNDDFYHSLLSRVQAGACRAG